MSGILRSRGSQAAAAVLACLLMAALNRHSDGLWFQGDAPRHAVNGLFWWDLLRAMPRDPIDFAVRYYARYPVIAPATYPPLFYVVEGVAFSLLGPSPYAARLVVLLFACMTGLYTMAWSRRWLGPEAGWTGAFLAFVPAMTLWSNTVMLNVPATALGLAALYHFRRWLETLRASSLLAAAVFATAVLFTYYPGAAVIVVLAVWYFLGARDRHVDRRLAWVAIAALVAVVPLIAALFLAPVHTSRQLPSIASLMRITTWTYYWATLPAVVGPPVLALGLLGCAAGLASPRRRRETLFVASWIVVLLGALSLLPARDPRYILPAVPAFVIAAAIGIACAAQYLPRVASAWQGAALAFALVASAWLAARVHVPQVSGFQPIAAFLQERASADAVLYDGDYDGLFGFYVRALDPSFDRRLALADKVLYHYGPTTTFQWVEQSNVASAEEVVQFLRARLGCRWVAIEVTPHPRQAVGSRLLRQAVERSEFTFVTSFPIAGAGERRVDLYQLTAGVESVAAFDLTFPSLSNRTFPHVIPITR
jgi:hypothetical protein